MTVRVLGIEPLPGTSRVRAIVRAQSRERRGREPLASITLTLVLDPNAREARRSSLRRWAREEALRFLDVA
jgi:hypothetical protein